MFCLFLYGIISCWFQLESILHGFHVFEFLMMFLLVSADNAGVIVNPKGEMKGNVSIYMLCRSATPFPFF